MGKKQTSKRTEAGSKIAVYLEKDGKELLLNAMDCIAIINALVRTRQLECHIEYVQKIVQYSDCCINPACAFLDGGSRSDETIWLEIDGQDCNEGAYEEGGE